MGSRSDRPRKPRAARTNRTTEGQREDQNVIEPAPIAVKDRASHAGAGTRATDNDVRPNATAEASPKSEGQSVKDTAGTAQSSGSRAVPEHVLKRYVRVDDTFHFANGDPAFRDRGQGLSTQLENTEVIRDMIAIAKERGWDDIRIRGTERFRQEAWQHAKLAGLAVRGYEPSAVQRALLVRRMAGHGQMKQGSESEEGVHWSTRTRGSGQTQDAEELRRASLDASDTPRGERIHRGRLMEHGPAPYQFDPKADRSYFVKLEVAEGIRTIWGKDLERALKESLSKAKEGDHIQVRHLGEKPVTVRRPVRNEAGQVVDETQVVAYRSRWGIERHDFLADRAQAARIVRDPSIDARAATRQRPELAGTYWELHAAKLVAAKVFTERADRERFIERVRERLAEEIERGEPLRAARVRTPAQHQTPASDRSQERAQGRVLG